MQRRARSADTAITLQLESSPAPGEQLPGAFRKQSLQHMRDFKAFAEQGKDVRDANG
jgi:hypothetical protein